MRTLAYFSFWTGMALYAAIGLIGVVLFSMQPDIASATDGYGPLHAVAQK